MIALLASVFSFSACSDDEDEIDAKQLEGTWVSSHSEGYSYDEAGKHPWDFSFNPSNPTIDCEKIVVSKVSGNTYAVTMYSYYDKWEKDETMKLTLEGDKLIPSGEVSDGFTIKLLSINSKQLVIESKGRHEYGDYYSKVTYKRM